MKNQRLRARIISAIFFVVGVVSLMLLGLNWAAAVVITLVLATALLILTSSLSKRVQNFSTWIAYVLIGMAIASGLFWGVPQIKYNLQAPALLTGFVGGERYELLVRDLEVKQLLKEQNLQLNEGSISKKGSISQLKALSTKTDWGELDFLWTGDAPIAEAGKELIEAAGIEVLRNEATLSDPLVLIVERTAAQILAQNNFFTRLDSNDFAYQVDTITLTDFLFSARQWQDLGLTRYASPPGLIISNSKKSNGGAMAETLLATIWSNLQNADFKSLSSATKSDSQQFYSQSDLSRIEPLPEKISVELAGKLRQFRLNSGFAESTSSKIQVQLEEGGIPWALTYYSLAKTISKQNDSFVLVSLSHTLVNSNQFLALSERGIELLNIIQTPRFQEIAKKYGYETPNNSSIVLPDANYSTVKNLTGL